MAGNDMDKSNMIKLAMNLATRVKEVEMDIRTFIDQWDGKDLGTGGANEIDDTFIETTSLPINATNLNSKGVYSLRNLLKFLDNDTPAAAQHGDNLAIVANVDGEYTITLP